MRVAAILGLGCSERDLKPFQQDCKAAWTLGLPAAGEADAILVSGGDGTIHRHLGSLVKLGLPVLVVPRGSGNDFARALGLRKVGDAVAAWCSFASGEGNVRTIDLGVITPLFADEHRGSDALRGLNVRTGSAKYFCCVGGVGLDAEVARRANALPRWLRGHGGYALSLPPALMKFLPSIMTVSLPSAGQQGGFAVRSSKTNILVAFANTANYGGGMAIAPKAKMDDGLLDICLVNDLNRVKLFCLFPTVYFGRHLGMKDVEYFQAQQLRLETARTARCLCRRRICLPDASRCIRCTGGAAGDCSAVTDKFLVSGF